MVSNAIFEGFGMLGTFLRVEFLRFSEHPLRVSEMFVDGQFYWVFAMLSMFFVMTESTKRSP